MGQLGRLERRLEDRRAGKCEGRAEICPYLLQLSGLAISLSSLTTEESLPIRKGLTNQGAQRTGCLHVPR